MDQSSAELESAESLDVVEFVRPPDGWDKTSTRTSLLPAALLGVAALLAWRFIGVRLLRGGAVQSDWVPLLLGGVLPSVFILAYPIWSIRRAGGRVFSGWPGWGSVLLEGGIALGALICVQFLNFLMAIVYTLISGEAPGIPNQFQEMVDGGSIATLVVMAVMACCWAPVAEELFFRRFLLRALANKYSLVAAIGVQAFVFAIMHDYGGMHLAAIFVLGVAMGGLYAWRKTILTSMMLHMFQNTMAMTVLGVIVLISRTAPTMGIYGEAEKTGFRVTEVVENSPAAAAGLQPGDVITHVAGTPVHEVLELRMLYWADSLDGGADVTIKRGDETLSLHVVPSKADPQAATPASTEEPAAPNE